MLEIRKVHQDERGKIYIIEGQELKELKEIVLLVTKAGYARGGCKHTVDEHCVVIEGKVHYVINKAKIDMEKGQYELIPAHSPHYYFSLTDSVVMEWGVNPEEKQNKDLKFKEIVDEHNRRVKND